MLRKANKALKGVWEYDFTRPSGHAKCFKLIGDGNIGYYQQNEPNFFEIFAFFNFFRDLEKLIFQI